MESLGLDWKLLLAQIVNFVLLFVVLKKLLYKPLIKLIDDRNNKIKDALLNSRKIEERLKNIEDKESELIEKALKKAKKEKDDLLILANIEKEKIIEEAKEQAKREIQKGLENIESARKSAIGSISDKYLTDITGQLYKKLLSESGKKNYPVLKDLLKK